MSGENFIVGVILAGKAITQFGTPIEFLIKNFNPSFVRNISNDSG